MPSRLGSGIRAAGILLTICLAACANPPASITTALPGAGAVPGWQPSGDVQAYNSDNLFNLVDGQADGFFAYDFVQAVVRKYQDANGVALHAEVWQLASPADAYGLFTLSCSGVPAAVGNDGDADPGRRLTFWQDRYYVSLSVVQPVEDSSLTALARAISSALPTGGERPALKDRLPSSVLSNRDYVFFRKEISIQDKLWLGGKNILGLSSDTIGVLAKTNLGTPGQLLVVQYPDAAKASAGLAALQAASLKSLIAADTRGNLLAAVFGSADKAAASQLMSEVLR